MLKLIAVGMLGVVATGTGAYVGTMMQAKDHSEQAAEHPPEIVNIATELSAVPVISDGKVTAYVLMKVSSSIDKSALKVPEDSVVSYLGDAAFRAAFEFAASGVKEVKARHIEELSTEIIRLADARIGAGAVKAVNLEQFNLVPESKIRGNSIKEH